MFIHFNQDPEEIEKIAKKLGINPTQLSNSAPAASLDLWKTLLNNKIVVSFIGFVLTLIVLWGVWVTNSIHAQDKEGAVRGECIENVEQDVGEVKETTKEIQVEQKEMRKEQHDRDLKFMEMLNKIDKKL